MGRLSWQSQEAENKIDSPSNRLGLRVRAAEQMSRMIPRFLSGCVIGGGP